MRKIAVMIGSESDLDQCESGLNYLKRMERRGKIKVTQIYIASVHRNLGTVMENIAQLIEDEVDAVIVGAGWANHLTGITDAHLRYQLRNDHIVVMGVAFEDSANDRHTQAAILSITEVPKTQVVFNGFVGSEGFSAACKFTAESDLPKIKLPEPIASWRVSLQAAIDFVGK